jgi:type 1 fimbria pilin
MKKIALALALGALTITSAQAVDLATGRLLFNGKLEQSGCTIANASGGGGDINVAMPGALGLGLVRAVGAGAATVAWNNLDPAVKSSSVADFSLSISCPAASDAIYTYVAGLTTPASTPAVVRAAWTTNAKLYFYGTGNGASGFIGAAASGSQIGVLAADATASNRSVGIAVNHTNAAGGQTLVDLNPTLAAAGVAITPVWTTTATEVSASPSFDFAYVPAATGVAVAGGVTTATLPFKFEYR